MEKILKNKDKVKRVLRYMEYLLDAPEDVLEAPDAYREERVILSLCERYAFIYTLEEEWEITKEI